MNFAACFEKSRHLLLEGALGERLKREYGLKIDGTAAMAPLVYDPQAQKALAALWAEYRGIAQEYACLFWRRRRLAGRTERGRRWPAMMRRCFWTISRF